jgi:hypothetical protein
MRAIVITGIHGKTPSIEAYERMPGWHVIVVGDRKSIPIASSQTLTYLSMDDQRDLGFSYTALCPENHYSRKNIGYLYALQQGAESMYDTDDDNVPLPEWKEPEHAEVMAGESATGFANVYRYFGDTFCWPRGFPLDALHGEEMNVAVPDAPLEVGVWQSLADSDPDVDAIFRMVFPGRVSFERKTPLVLRAGTYSPFNSQATFWKRAAAPLLYLPSTVSFRFTDILRGYIAQRLLWEQGIHVGFTSPLVRQDRNAHDLMSDFESEVPCQLQVRPLALTLQGMALGSDAFANVRSVYAALSEAKIVEKGEVAACAAWLSDAEAILGPRS